MNEAAAIDGVAVSKCAQCGAFYFPDRLVCRHCGGGVWNATRITDAIVEESTTLSDVPGRQQSEQRGLATVRTAEGLHLVVAIRIPLANGTPVALFEEDCALFAKPRTA